MITEILSEGGIGAGQGGLIQLPQPITVYNHRQNPPMILDKSYEIAESFLREEAGLPIRFEPLYGSPFSIDTDHTTKFVTTEVYKKDLESFAREAVKAGKGAIQDRVVDLLENNVIFYAFASTETGISPLVEEERTKPDFNPIYHAKVIAHEICHFFGLWHPENTFENDETKLVVDGVTNFMRKGCPSPKGKYGYSICELQKRLITDFLTYGITYQTMRDSGWGFEQHIENVGKILKLAPKKRERSAA